MKCIKNKQKSSHFKWYWTFSQFGKVMKRIHKKADLQKKVRVESNLNAHKTYTNVCIFQSESLKPIALYRRYSVDAICFNDSEHKTTALTLTY